MTIQTIKSFYNDEAGQDLVEYSLLLGFLACASIALLTAGQTAIKGIWTAIDTQLAAAATAAS